eukprot:364429-Chlamydomonas_euryale.AAC.19
MRPPSSSSAAPTCAAVARWRWPGAVQRARYTRRGTQGARHTGCGTKGVVQKALYKRHGTKGGVQSAGEKKPGGLKRGSRGMGRSLNEERRRGLPVEVGGAAWGGPCREGNAAARARALRPGFLDAGLLRLP